MADEMAFTQASGTTAEVMKSLHSSTNSES